MPQVQIITLFSNFITASVFATLTWLFADALTVRLEVKTLFKTVGCTLITAAIILDLFHQGFFSLTQPFNLLQFTFWLQSLGLWLLFVAFVFDSHSKLQFLFVIAIVTIFLFRGYTLLTIQSALIALTTLALAYVTKHKDLIPLGVGFVLITAGHFFYALEQLRGFEGLGVTGSFLNIFASISLFVWLWQYLIIRFNLGKNR